MFTLLNLLLAVFFGAMALLLMRMFGVPKPMAALVGLTVGVSAYLANFAEEVL